MPNFNTHWLVAIKCIETGKLPNDIKAGYDNYLSLTEQYETELTQAIKSVTDRKSRKKFINEILDKRLKKYNDALTKPENHDPITLFSAYMLGACGPDFWTVTSRASGFNPKPNTAGIHFDLGHYNRSHRQFQVAIDRWKGMDKDSFQVRTEQAYFYGMATHIATDCTVHQLVNVYAGAYHLLVKDNWENEHGSLPVNLWNTHNKVEHYWDSYIRYKYFGNAGPVFEKNGKILDQGMWMPALGFPTTEAYIADLAKEVKDLEIQCEDALDNKDRREYLNDKIKAKTKLIDSLKKDKIKIKIENAFIFPRIFCDRVIEGNGIKPFLYDIIVRKEEEGDKKPGAYEKDIIFPAAIEEATHFQMQGPVVDGKQTYNENKKLAYFATTENAVDSVPGTSFNYLNYYVCPNLEKVKLYGWNNFYHIQSLKPFLDKAVIAGKRFIESLSSGISEHNPDGIGLLNYFWNLDTGLGLQVKNFISDTRKEVITELNFIHITEAINQRINAVTPDVHAKIEDSAAIIQFSNPSETAAFDTYQGKIFDSLLSVSETDSNKYLDRIFLEPPETRMQDDFCINNFFMGTSEDCPTRENAPTNETTMTRYSDIKHRLNLRLRVPIAELYENENLGFYVHNDKKATLPTTKKSGIKSLHDWIKNCKPTDFIETKQSQAKSCRFIKNNGLCVFESRLLMNLEPETDLVRKLEKGEWNNVIPYKDLLGKQYNRNYSVSTGRINVIVPKGSGNFKGQAHFKMYDNVSPTEQVFFTLHPLVQTPYGYFDMLSKEDVDEEKLKEIKKIDVLGIVKIVLFYKYTDNHGALQADDCYIDGLQIPIDRFYM